ncbi:MAG TPA: anti-sigma regulatory factor [Nitrospira sp.]|jgi:serine/threonine-protein kinase RsbT|nr:anti-sigma regulatory factor [Nitrospira sp.]
MAVLRDELIGLRSMDDVIKARQLVRDCAIFMGLSLVDQTKLVTAASELARNTIVHGGGGEMRLQALNDGARRGVSAVFADTGPGIPDLELAMKDGYSTRGGLGLGLSGAKRLVNEFAIETQPGAGTTVSIVRWK